MADRNVVPKKRRSIILWILTGISLIVVLFFLTRRPYNEELTIAAITSTSSHAAKYKWNRINFNAPAANYNEITSRQVVVKETNNYAIYSLQEDILFDKNNSTLRLESIEALHQIANSIEQRYTNGLIRIYEHIDGSASEGKNLQLTQQRTETIRNWFLQNGNISAKQLTIQPVGVRWPVDSLQSHEDLLKKSHLDIVAIRAY